ncbi:MAG: leucine-rich repeat protein, partial [Clostridia bacterium]|nr:leucine-rich repeat protein [Clostridia bacterium]
MKKALVLILTLILTAFAIFSFSACNSVEFEIKFIVDGEVYDTVKTGGNSIIAMPENPTKKGYTFEGWYWDNDTWKRPFDANSLVGMSLSNDINVYAKWVLAPTDDGQTTPPDGDSDANTPQAPIHTHALTHNVRVEATCTADGTIEYWHCSVCDKNYTDANATSIASSTLIPKHGLTHNARVEATCTADGAIEYWHCAVCNKNYSDAKAENEVSSIVIPAGHNASASSDLCTRCRLVSFKGLKFTLQSDNTYAVTDYTGNASSIVIPDMYEDILVTAIGSSAFEDCTSLTSVTIPNSVTSIGSSAFSYCTLLTSITIPNSVISIGSSAFEGCSSLESMTIPFAGGSIKKSTDTYQYPFGYIFGTSSYTGGTATKQYYYGSSTSSTTYTTYYIPTKLKSVTVTSGNILYGAFYNCT